MNVLVILDPDSRRDLGAIGSLLLRNSTAKRA
jgi:hypothetical protein